MLLGEGVPGEVTGNELAAPSLPISREPRRRNRAMEKPRMCLCTEVLLQQRGDVYLGVPVKDGEEIVSGAQLSLLRLAVFS